MSYVQTGFTGGEISQAAQGRMDVPAYKMSMNVCLNGIPVESGAWLRRPGTLHVGPNRGGATGKLIKFAFEESFPYQMVFTDGFLRFTTGPALVMTNDAQAVVAISSANPAVVQTTSAHGWSTGNSVMFNSFGVNNPLLQNRQFLITVTDSTHFSLADAVTGTAIDGSTLGTFVSGNVTRILEIATNYVSGSWSSLRSVQAETRTVLLNGTHPEVLQVATLPTNIAFATFTYGAADFIDGPYLDPIAGSQVSSSALNGVVTLTFAFQAYDSTRAYNIGDFVTSSGQGYKSLTAINQGHTPASSPSNWLAVNGGAAVNNGQGFLTSDIGRLIRLLSEPQLWNVASTYVAKDVVAYADGAGGFSYWTATGAVAAGIQPGTSTLWALNATGATWTWAQIVSVSGAGLIAPATAIGTLTSGGNLAAAFDGNTTKAFASAANLSQSIATQTAWGAGSWAQAAICQFNGVLYQAQINIVTSAPQPFWSNSIFYPVNFQVRYGDLIYVALIANSGQNPTKFTGSWHAIYGVTSSPPPSAPGFWASVGSLSSPVLDQYIGQHYSVATAVLSATLYPSTDIGLANPPNGALPITVNLRAKSTAPSSASDGTLLATTSIANLTTAITLTSSDNTTTWSYVWFEITASYVQPLPDDGSHVFTAKIGVAQAQFYSPNVNNGSVITAQIRGPALLYNQTIRTWQAGVYSDTTGWPTCGAYHEGRIWFGGVVANRFDASVSNGLNGVELDFTPTDPNGTVADNNSISYICTGEDSNQLLWMTPDQQGVLFGTQAGEWLISAPGPGPMTPTNIKAVRVTKIGCANAEPRRAEHTLLFIQKFSRKIMEYFADVFSGKFSAPNLSERAKHLTVNGIAEIAYQQELAPIAWCRRNDGALVGATYKRDTLTTSQGPNIIGWHRHQLGSGRLLESIAVGPSHSGNLEALSLITNDPSTGIRHLEVMTDLLDEGFLLTDCMFLDDAIVPSSTVVNLSTSPSTWSAVTTYAAGQFVLFNGAEYVSTADGNLNNSPATSTQWLATPYGSITLYGLWAHNGKVVSTFVAGLDCGDYTVASGQITIPFGDGVSGGTGSGLFTAALVASFATLPAFVGFTYNSDGQLVRHIEQTGAGPTFAELGRTHRAGALLYGCVNGSISFGTDFATLDAAVLQNPNPEVAPVTVQDLYNGIWRDNINSIYDFDGMISWRISRPLPAFVIAVGGFDSRAQT
jgi:hypothetical protein